MPADRGEAAYVDVLADEGAQFSFLSARRVELRSPAPESALAVRYPMERDVRDVVEERNRRCPAGSRRRPFRRRRG